MKNMREEIEKIYKKNINRKIQEIEKVSTDAVLKARVNNFIKLYPKRISLVLMLSILILVLSFYSNIKLLTLVLFMYVFMLLFSIYCNTFTIKCKNNRMIVDANMQEITIEYKDLKNVYIDKKYERIFIKKRAFYKLIILYKAPNKNISNIELPIIFAKIEEIEKFLCNFNLKPEKSKQNIQMATQYKLKRFLIKVCLFILVWILIFITMLIL